MRPPPQTETELQNRLDAIAGLSVTELAEQLGEPVAENLRHHKGWLGDLIEHALGCDAASLSEPDFTSLGIELKTVPLNKQGKVQESTYVCAVPMQTAINLQWQQSCVYKKLRYVLWLPVEADASIPLAQRRIGQGLLWRAPETALQCLQQDWEEHMDRISMGQFESITAHQGEVLQIRPKAANSKVLCDAIGPEGKIIKTLPRGFYLRPSFTRNILYA